MRYELETFFSNPCESSGLLIAEAPTGYGKTYETIQAIYRYIEKGGKSQILFITNLLKNLPDDELRNIYEQNGRGALFKKEVLVLSSVASNVEKVILTEKIPPEFQTDAYQELLSACQKKKQYQQQFGEAGKDITKHMGDQIREKLEPQFRRELEVHLQKTFPGGPGPRRDAIRNKEKYKWMATFYDWSKLGFNKPITFVVATFDYKNQSKPICYDMLRVQPSGELYFESWQQSFCEDNSEREKISAAFETPYGKFDTTIKGLVYEEEDNIHIIYDTDRYTLPNMQDLELVLSATRDDEQIPVMPLVETIQKYACSLSGTERARCQIILDAINQHGMKVSRKELRHILNLKSNLGKQINRFIFEESGVLIGNALKSARNKEALFGGVLGIRHFCKDDAQYYYSGYLGKSINRSFPHACRIRKVCSTGQTLQFQRYLPLLEVDFIRANGWTVIPFPFKYLREWRLQQG